MLAGDPAATVACLGTWADTQGGAGNVGWVQLLDLEVPTTDGRWLVTSRYTQPEKAVDLLLARLKMKLPDQPPPRLSTEKTLIN